ncbi:hypothetical protein Cob_v000962 [Colletotrichum orbiculare MAFF 240422]|uniref:Uncharacterized protein n=1 Tax=Colletotrichum orbiculare (strain 104-T / ATCC 96160 / CBS 514.97 / LARS 414 / MAFF 240422) TaxID=1213857 RepID=A0A484G6V6_COLOR|nr:hypothetical protein Cob_v000962 [Colletotrichum orbiculare MAFF 240422]
MYRTTPNQVNSKQTLVLNPQTPKGREKRQHGVELLGLALGRVCCQDAGIVVQVSVEGPCGRPKRQKHADVLEPMVI